MRLAFVDLETTGGSPVEDRITEVGIIEVDFDRAHPPRPVREWSALVNPDATIPPFIETLTGITNAMVAEAPRFADLADDILTRLEGRLFVAHNARFDHGFLKNAFRRLARPFRPRVLCTVRLSRKLYPGYARHNLDTLIERHRLAVDMRHRALGDARLLWQLWQKFHDALPADQIEAAITQLTARPSLPRHVDPDVLDSLPTSAGVYLFLGAPIDESRGDALGTDAGASGVMNDRHGTVHAATTIDMRDESGVRRVLDQHVIDRNVEEGGAETTNPVPVATSSETVFDNGATADADVDSGSASQSRFDVDDVDGSNIDDEVGDKIRGDIGKARYNDPKFNLDIESEFVDDPDNGSSNVGNVAFEADACNAMDGSAVVGSDLGTSRATASRGTDEVNLLVHWTSSRDGTTAGYAARSGSDPGGEGPDAQAPQQKRIAYVAEPRPLYIGKAKNLRQRVMAHFTGDHRSAREMEISQQMTQIEWIETGGGTQQDLGALLMEATLVKQRMPAYNRQLRRSDDVCAWRLVVAQGHVRASQPRWTLALARPDDLFFAQDPDLYGPFATPRQAGVALRAIVDAHGLCPALMKLEKRYPGRPCFSHQVKQCRGACVGLETEAEHTVRLKEALKSISITPWPFDGPVAFREGTTWHVVGGWAYLGMATNLDAAGRLALKTGWFDPDIYRLLFKLTTPSSRVSKRSAQFAQYLDNMSTN